MPAKTPGEKQAQKFFGAINSLDFDIVMFLFELDKQSQEMKERVFTIFTMLIDDWAMRYDAVLWHNETEMNMFANAKRVQEALYPYLINE
jgi:hypothetical protein